MLYLAKKFDFCASHTLYRDEWSPEKNVSVFGKCANGHGHNYVLEVAVRGAVNSTTNMILDAGRLRIIVEELILHDLDHKDLNSDVSWLQGIIPTVEAVVNAIWERLAPAIKEEGCQLARIILHETSTIYAWREE